MRRLALVIGATLAGSMLAASGRAVNLDISVSFYDSLAPYGEWIENDRFGTVWTPRHIDSSWRPYTRGEWVYTDDGWTWASDDDWGWATDHYGRWFLDPVAGWIWVPGDEWAPAWVAWRYGDGYVGWAPLPPGADVFGDVDISIDPLAFCFVEQRRFLEPGIYRHLVPVARNVTYISLTTNVTHYRRVNERVFNRGIDVHHFERATGHTVPRARIREVWSAADARRARVGRGEVAFFHPSVVSSRPTAAPGVQGTWHPNPNASHPERIDRRQEHERQQLESTLVRERRRLEQVQQHEIKHPPQGVVERREHEPQRPRAVAQPGWVNRKQLEDRHEAERKAQAEIERRQREVLQQRQQREQRSIQAQKEKGKPEDSSHKHDRH